MVKHLEEELGHLKSELSSWQHLKTSCEEVDTIHGKASCMMFYHKKEKNTSAEVLGLLS